MRQLMLDKLYFIREKSFACGRIKNKNKHFYTIIYDKKLSREDGGFLTILHEIGHAHNNEKIDSFTVSKIIKLGIDAEFLSKTELLEKYSDKERGILLQNERNAWAWAIKTARELKRQGIDLISELNKEQIKKWIYDETRLTSYERELDITPVILRNIRKEKLEFFKNEKR